MPFQKPKFVKLPDDFKVTVSHSSENEERFTWCPSGLHISHERSAVYIQYAGDRAGESDAKLTVPYEPAVLRKFAAALIELAKEKK